MTKRWKVQLARDWYFLEVYLNQLQAADWTIHQVMDDSPSRYIIIAYKETP